MCCIGYFHTHFFVNSKRVVGSGCSKYPKFYGKNEKPKKSEFWKYEKKKKKKKKNAWHIIFGIVLWYPSLADDDTLLNICPGHHLTMVTGRKGM